MANIKIQGKARFSIMRPRMATDAAGEFSPSRAEQLQSWAVAVMKTTFDPETSRLVTRVEIGWLRERDGDVELDMWMPQEWDAAKIRAYANELADKMYAGCGTSLATQLAIDAERSKTGERFREPRVRVEWVQREVA